MRGDSRRQCLLNGSTPRGVHEYSETGQLWRYAIIVAD